MRYISESIYKCISLNIITFFCFYIFCQNNIYLYVFCWFLWSLMKLRGWIRLDTFFARNNILCKWRYYNIYDKLQGLSFLYFDSHRIVFQGLNLWYIIWLLFEYKFKVFLFLYFLIESLTILKITVDEYIFNKTEYCRNPQNFYYVL